MKFLTSLALIFALSAPAMAAPLTPDVVGAVTKDVRESRAEETQEETLKKVEETLVKVAEAVTAAPEAVEITDDYGGSVFEYITKYNTYRKNKTKLRITDYCLSACTFVTGLVKKENVCVTEHTQFGFHNAYQMNPFTGETKFNREATRLIWNMYPHDLQDNLRKRGWDGDGEKPQMEFIYIKGTDLYPLCAE